MKTYETIQAEVGSAIEFVRTGGVAPDIAVQTSDLYASLAEHLDDTLITHYVAELPDYGPASVTVETPEEFAMIYDALGKVHRVPVAPRKIRRDIEHETEHLKVTQKLGFQAVRYGLLVTSSTRGSYEWRPFHTYAEPTREVTKLAIASQVAAPRKLSGGDILRLKTMGYSGAKDVGERIVTAEDPQLSALPLPQSFSGRR